MTTPISEATPLLQGKKEHHETSSYLNNSQKQDVVAAQNDFDTTSMLYQSQSQGGQDNVVNTTSGDTTVTTTTATETVAAAAAAAGERDTTTTTSGCCGMFASLSGTRKYTLILMTTAISLSSIAFSLLGPFYPSEAAKKGMNIDMVGVVFGLYQAVIFLTSPFFGIYLVKLGPKFVFVTGIFVAGSCNILFGTLQYCPAGTSFVVMSIVVRAVEALGFAGFITSCYAIVASEFNDHVAFTFGILETGSGVGFILGPTIGGLLYEFGGFGLPFYAAGVAVLLNGLAVYKFLPRSLVEELPSKRKGSMFTLLRTPMVVIPLASVMVGMIGITTYDSTFAKRVEPMEFSAGLVGALFGVVAAVYSIMSSIWGYVSDTVNVQSPLIIAGHFVFGLGFLILGPSDFLYLSSFVSFNLTTVIIGLAFIGVSFGCCLVPTMKCMMIGAMEAGFDNDINTTGLVSGLFSSLQTFGGFIGPVGVTYLVEHYGFPIAYTAVGLLSIFMMFVSIVFFSIRNYQMKKKKRSSSSENKIITRSSTDNLNYDNGLAKKERLTPTAAGLNLAKATAGFSPTKEDNIF